MWFRNKNILVATSRILLTVFISYIFLAGNVVDVRQSAGSDENASRASAVAFHGAVPLAEAKTKADIFTPRVQATVNSLVTLLVDEETFKTLTKKVKRYAQDIQGILPYTRVDILPISPRDDVYDISRTLERFYRGEHFDPSVPIEEQLVGVIVLGDVPIPEVWHEKDKFLSMYPYTDFDDRAYVWDIRTRKFKRDRSVTDPRVEVWHGVIKPPVPINDGRYFSLLENYLDKNHKYHCTLNPIKTSDCEERQTLTSKMPTNGKIFMADLNKRQERESIKKIAGYLKRNSLWKDIAWRTGDLLDYAGPKGDKDKQNISSVQNLKYRFITQPISMGSKPQGKLFTMTARSIKDRILDEVLPNYTKTFPNYVSDIRGVAGNSGRFQASDVDNFVSLITDLDAKYLNKLKKAQQKLNDVILHDNKRGEIMGYMPGDEGYEESCVASGHPTANKCQGVDELEAANYNAEDNIFKAKQRFSGLLSRIAVPVLESSETQKKQEADHVLRSLMVKDKVAYDELHYGQPVAGGIYIDYDYDELLPKTIKFRHPADPFIYENKTTTIQELQKLNDKLKTDSLICGVFKPSAQSQCTEIPKVTKSVGMETCRGVMCSGAFNNVFTPNYSENTRRYYFNNTRVDTNGDGKQDTTYRELWDKGLQTFEIPDLFTVTSKSKLEKILKTETTKINTLIDDANRFGFARYVYGIANYTCTEEPKTSIEHFYKTRFTRPNWKESGPLPCTGFNTSVGTSVNTNTTIGPSGGLNINKVEFPGFDDWAKMSTDGQLNGIKQIEMSDLLSEDDENDVLDAISWRNKSIYDKMISVIDEYGFAKEKYDAVYLNGSGERNYIELKLHDIDENKECADDWQESSFGICPNRQVRHSLKIDNEYLIKHPPQNAFTTILGLAANDMTKGGNLGGWWLFSPNSFTEAVYSTTIPQNKARLLNPRADISAFGVDDADQSSAVGFVADDRFMLNIAAGMEFGPATKFYLPPTAILAGDPTAKLWVDNKTNKIDSNQFTRDHGVQFKLSDSTVVDMVNPDINGDGFPDLVVAYKDGKVEVFENTNSLERFVSRTIVPFDDGVAGLTYGDYNKDGLDEVVVMTYEPSELSLLKNNKGVLEREKIAFEHGKRLMSMVTFDTVNKDGYPEIIVTDSAGSIITLENKGDYVFQRVAAQERKYGVKLDASEEHRSDLSISSDETSQLLAQIKIQLNTATYEKALQGISDYIAKSGKTFKEGFLGLAPDEALPSQSEFDEYVKNKLAKFVGGKPMKLITKLRNAEKTSVYVELDDIHERPIKPGTLKLKLRVDNKVESPGMLTVGKGANSLTFGNNVSVDMDTAVNNFSSVVQSAGDNFSGNSEKVYEAKLFGHKAVFNNIPLGYLMDFQSLGLSYQGEDLAYLMMTKEVGETKCLGKDGQTIYPTGAVSDDCKNNPGGVMREVSMQVQSDLSKINLSDELIAIQISDGIDSVKHNYQAGRLDFSRILLNKNDGEIMCQQDAMSVSGATASWSAGTDIDKYQIKLVTGVTPVVDSKVLMGVDGTSVIYTAKLSNTGESLPRGTMIEGVVCAGGVKHGLGEKEIVDDSASFAVPNAYFANGEYDIRYRFSKIPEVEHKIFKNSFEAVDSHADLGSSTKRYVDVNGGTLDRDDLVRVDIDLHNISDRELSHVQLQDTLPDYLTMLDLSNEYTGVYKQGVVTFDIDQDFVDLVDFATTENIFTLKPNIPAKLAKTRRDFLDAYKGLVVFDMNQNDDIFVYLDTNDDVRVLKGDPEDIDSMKFIARIKKDGSFYSVAGFNFERSKREPGTKYIKRKDGTPVFAYRLLIDRDIPVFATDTDINIANLRIDTSRMIGVVDAYRKDGKRMMDFEKVKLKASGFYKLPENAQVKYPTRDSGEMMISNFSILGKEDVKISYAARVNKTENVGVTVCHDRVVPITKDNPAPIDGLTDDGGLPDNISCPRPPLSVGGVCGMQDYAVIPIKPKSTCKSDCFPIIPILPYPQMCINTCLNTAPGAAVTMAMCMTPMTCIHSPAMGITLPALAGRLTKSCSLNSFALPNSLNLQFNFGSGKLKDKDKMKRVIKPGTEFPGVIPLLGDALSGMHDVINKIRQKPRIVVNIQKFPRLKFKKKSELLRGRIERLENSGPRVRVGETPEESADYRRANIEYLQKEEQEAKAEEEKEAERQKSRSEEMARAVRDLLFYDVPVPDFIDDPDQQGILPMISFIDSLKIFKVDLKPMKIFYPKLEKKSLMNLTKQLESYPADFEQASRVFEYKLMKKIAEVGEGALAKGGEVLAVPGKATGAATGAVSGAAINIWVNGIEGSLKKIKSEFTLENFNKKITINDKPVAEFGETLKSYVLTIPTKITKLEALSLDIASQVVAIEQLLQQIALHPELLPEGFAQQCGTMEKLMNLYQQLVEYQDKIKKTIANLRDLKDAILKLGLDATAKMSEQITKEYDKVQGLYVELSTFVENIGNLSLLSNAEGIFLKRLNDVYKTLRSFLTEGVITFASALRDISNIEDMLIKKLIHMYQGFLSDMLEMIFNVVIYVVKGLLKILEGLNRWWEAIHALEGALDDLLKLPDMILEYLTNCLGPKCQDQTKTSTKIKIVAKILGVAMPKIKILNFAGWPDFIINLKFIKFPIHVTLPMVEFVPKSISLPELPSPEAFIKEFNELLDVPLKFPKIPDIPNMDALLDIKPVNFEIPKINLKVTLPELPKIPELDLKKVKLSDIGIEIPNITLPPLPPIPPIKELKLPVLPNISLPIPEIPNISATVKIPEIPEIPIPELPDLPKIPILPKLPVLVLPPIPEVPIPPKIPKIADQIFKSIKPILQIVCMILKGSIIHPQFVMTDVAEVLTMPRAAPYNVKLGVKVGGQPPDINFSANIPKKIVIETKPISVGPFTELYDLFKAITEPLNSMTDQVVQISDTLGSLPDLLKDFKGKDFGASIDLSFSVGQLKDLKFTLPEMPAVPLLPPVNAEISAPAVKAKLPPVNIPGFNFGACKTLLPKGAPTTMLERFQIDVQRLWNNVVGIPEALAVETCPNIHDLATLQGLSLTKKFDYVKADFDHDGDLDMVYFDGANIFYKTNREFVPTVADYYRLTHVKHRLKRPVFSYGTFSPNSFKIENTSNRVVTMSFRPPYAIGPKRKVAGVETHIPQVIAHEKYTFTEGDRDFQIVLKLPESDLELAKLHGNRFAIKEPGKHGKVYFKIESDRSFSTDNLAELQPLPVRMDSGLLFELRKQNKLLAHIYIPKETIALTSSKTYIMNIAKQGQDGIAVQVVYRKMDSSAKVRLRVEGDGSIKKLEKESWANVKSGELLELGDMIFLNSRKKAQLIFNDGSVVNILPKTKLLLAQLDSARAPNVKLRLPNGSYIANVQAVDTVGNMSYFSNPVYLHPSVGADSEPPFANASVQKVMNLFEQVTIDAGSSDDDSIAQSGDPEISWFALTGEKGKDRKYFSKIAWDLDGDLDGNLDGILNNDVDRLAVNTTYIPQTEGDKYISLQVFDEADNSGEFIRQFKSEVRAADVSISQEDLNKGIISVLTEPNTPVTIMRNRGASRDEVIFKLVTSADGRASKSNFVKDKFGGYIARASEKLVEFDRDHHIKANTPEVSILALPTGGALDSLAVRYENHLIARLYLIVDKNLDVEGFEPGTGELESKFLDEGIYVVDTSGMVDFKNVINGLEIQSKGEKILTVKNGGEMRDIAEGVSLTFAPAKDVLDRDALVVRNANKEELARIYYSLNSQNNMGILQAGKVVDRQLAKSGLSVVDLDRHDTLEVKYTSALVPGDEIFAAILDINDIPVSISRAYVYQKE